MKINHPSELKCPFCSSEMLYVKFPEGDGSTEVSLGCISDNSISCGITIGFGVFGKGVKDIDRIVVDLINQKFNVITIMLP